MSFDDAVAALGASARRDLGLQAVALDTIVGSVGRPGDFDRCFRPGPKIDGRRWESLNRAMRSGRSLPPITVYRVGGVHYVLDGHHRVSVALALGMRTVDAVVTELLTPHVPISRSRCGVS